MCQLGKGVGRVCWVGSVGERGGEGVGGDFWGICVASVKFSHLAPVAGTVNLINLI